MADKQTIFNNCRGIYEDAYDLVKQMACAVGKTLEKEGKDFDPRITTGKFDIVLQYSLLQVAVSDFDLDVNEVIFIKDLTKQGDIVSYLNAIEKDAKYPSWDELYNSGAKNVRKWLRDIESDMKQLSEEFVTVFALCDAITEYDYLSDILKQIAAIILGLAMMDGDPGSEDLKENILILEALNEIAERKKNIK